MIDISEFKKSRFLSSADLTTPRTRVRIKGVSKEMIGTPPEARIVLTFTTETLKPMVCNLTNLTTLVSGFGPDERTWIGQIIVLQKTTTAFQGKTCDAVRVEVPAQPPVAAVPRTLTEPPAASMDAPPSEVTDPADDDLDEATLA